MSDMQQDKFWQTLSLSEMSNAQWESLCDGCGRCCLVKLEDDENEGDVYYTDVACQYLDVKSCQCTDYVNRFANAPNCIKLSPQRAHEFHWLPSTCAYRLVSENKPLPAWHPLISGDAQSVINSGVSVAGKVIPETEVSEDELEERIINWIW